MILWGSRGWCEEDRSWKSRRTGGKAEKQKQKQKEAWRGKEVRRTISGVT